jgi:hypothetical protein
VFAGLAEAALWDGRLADARAAVADGLAILATAEEPYWVTELCQAGLAVEAALAEHARAAMPRPRSGPPASGRTACSTGSTPRPPHPMSCRPRP